ncbi:MAG TPA: DUF2946 family protein [Burkholderiaceae bacterium]
MRKLLLSLLLPFVLLLSQQGAIEHELGHLTDAVAQANGAGAGGSRGGHAPGDLQCQACLAFAHLAGVATVQVAAFAPIRLHFDLPAVVAPAFIAADAPGARSRGPPPVL